MATLTDLQERVHEARITRGFSMEPAQMIAMLAEEVREVARTLKPAWSNKYGNLSKENLSNELADALVCVLALGSRFEIDLERAVEEKFFKSDAKRDRKSELWSLCSFNP